MSPLLDLNTTLSPVPSVVAKPVPDATLLVDLKKGFCWSLNRLGGEVWSLIDGRRSLGEICTTLQVRYEVSNDVLERDVMLLAAEMLNQEIVSSEIDAVHGSK